MNNIELVLEFNLIKEKLVKLAVMDINKRALGDLSFSTNKDYLKEELERTDEALRLLHTHGVPSLYNISDITTSLERLEKNSYLSINELYNIRLLLKGIKEIRNYYKKVTKKDYLYFTSLVNSSLELTSIAERLDKVLNEDKGIKDDASLTLKKIRQELFESEGKIKDKLKEIIAKHSTLLNDTNIHYKNNKYVLALNASNKYKLGGIIIEESSSGYTSYVEPEVTYKISQRINKLKQTENEEIIKILKNLSNYIVNYIDELTINYNVVVDFDYKFAKAKYAKEINAKKATIEEDRLVLKGARHPLIRQDEVIANDFILGGDTGKVLIISGPNAGGKTVALKTLGLLSYMNQCGLLISVDHEARLPIFTNFYADIGDSQSIIDSLSTFTSHISNIIEIIDNSSSNSLILLDELGSGTNPSEGEALAMAIIDYLSKSNSYLLTTTHYDNLKAFAASNNNLRISAMEFDNTSIKPTFRLLDNEIGKSYAFEIARRKGLNEEIIKKANEYQEEYASSSKKIIDTLQVKLEESELKLKLLQEKEARLDKKEIELDKLIAKTKEEANKEIENLVNESKREVDKILFDLRQNKILKPHHALKAIKDLEDLNKPQEEEKTSSNITFKIDDLVKIVSLNKEGKITSIKNDLYDVSIGNITLKVDGSDLKRVAVKKESKKVEFTTINKTGSPSLELNLIGKRVEESLLLLDEYLNSALVNKLESVRIVHGFGSGKLAKGIREYLDTLSFVKSYRYGGMNEGGQGATIVELK